MTELTSANIKDPNLLPKTSVETGNNEVWINDFAQKLKEHSLWTYEHSQRVSQISEKLGQHLDLNAHKLFLLKASGLLHDIGKIFVPLDILDNTKSELTEDQRKIIMQHPTDGFNLVKSFNLDVAKIIASHHEILHDNPYPRSKKRDPNDPLGNLKLIVSLADSVDAAISKRPYKPNHSEEEAFSNLSRFDVSPSLLKTAIKIRTELN